MNLTHTSLICQDWHLRRTSWNHSG